MRLKKIAPELTDSFTSLILYRTAGTLKKFKLFDSLRENKPVRVPVSGTAFQYLLLTTMSCSGRKRNCWHRC